VIAMMLHNGVDPTQTEGMTCSGPKAQRHVGMTPLESLRREVAMSPWRTDKKIGPMFDKTAETVHVVLEQAEKAVNLKNKGNKAFQDKRYTDAIKAYTEAREIWTAADIRGHHTAVLWSNEARCHMKNEQWSAAISACEEGLKHYCTADMRTKIENRLQEAKDEQGKAQLEAEAAASEAPQPVQGDAGCTEGPEPPSAKVAELALGEDAAKPAAAVKPKKPTAVKAGFLARKEQDLYPEGSVEGGSGKSAPFICNFDAAKEGGLVTGCEGWRDREERLEREINEELPTHVVSSNPGYKGK